MKIILHMLVEVALIMCFSVTVNANGAKKPATTKPAPTQPKITPPVTAQPEVIQPEAEQPVIIQPEEAPAVTCPPEAPAPVVCQPSVPCVPCGAGPKCMANYYKWYIRAGAAFPLGDVDNSVEPIVGIGWENKISEDPLFWGINLNYTPVSFTEAVTAAPVNPGTPVDPTASTVEQLIYLRKTGLFSNPAVWGMIGVGARWSSEDVPQLNLDEGENFLWSVGLGMDFTQRFFGDVRFAAGTQPSDDGYVSVGVGLRF